MLSLSISTLANFSNWRCVTCFKNSFTLASLLHGLELCELNCDHHFDTLSLLKSPILCEKSVNMLPSFLLVSSTHPHPHHTPVQSYLLISISLSYTYIIYIYIHTCIYTNKHLCCCCRKNLTMASSLSNAKLLATPFAYAISQLSINRWVYIHTHKHIYSLPPEMFVLVLYLNILCTILVICQVCPSLVDFAKLGINQVLNSNCFPESGKSCRKSNQRIFFKILECTSIFSIILVLVLFF